MILQGDCIEEMKKLKENSVDAIITDPPYGLGFMNKEWDSPAKHRELVARELKRSAERKAQGKSPTDAPFSQSVQPGLAIKGAKEGRWYQEWCEQWSKELFRILKPGGYFLSFCATRMYHRMTCGIEDAGFEIRDTIMWLYGSGFPKSLNIGKQIDKIQGNEREVVGKRSDFSYDNSKRDSVRHNETEDIKVGASDWNNPVTKGNSEWEGWGTALKPAVEPIVVARKPLSEKNVALNVLKWGTGGINIDACRIGTETIMQHGRRQKEGTGWKNHWHNDLEKGKEWQGRFPANIILDEDAGKILDEQTEGKVGNGHWAKTKVTGFGEFGNGKSEYFGVEEKDKNKGGASRFFYCAKASKSERNFGCEELEEKGVSINQPHNSKDLEERYAMKFKNNHPTVKPLKLMEYLIKLVSREGAVVLDPFLGSGTTAIACQKLNRKWIGIEKEEEYVKIAQARIKPFLEQQKLTEKGGKE